RPEVIMPTGKPARCRTGNEDGRCDYRSPGSDSGPCQGTAKLLGSLGADSGSLAGLDVSVIAQP
ncbi:hypothetical protein, partial [Mycobacterium kyorinense]|uniref:hypothetical protein n=1 Tax=Mycobacterium kyorinense TaxID=487514 RepID=UPI001F17CBBC